jgi:hypothetical protein
LMSVAQKEVRALKMLGKKEVKTTVRRRGKK